MKFGKKSILALALLVSTASHGVELRLLEFSPAKFFTSEDWALAKTTVGEALRQGKVGGPFAWLNDATGHRGAYIVLNILEDNGRKCRDLQILHEAEHLRGGGDYRFCLMDDGEWKAQGLVPEVGAPARYK